MVVIADRIVFCEVEKVREIALGHIVKAHRYTSLKRVLLCCRGIGEAPTNSDSNPCEEVLLASARILGRDVCNRAIGLLPHLVKSMHRVACVACVSGVRNGVGQKWLTAVVQF